MVFSEDTSSDLQTGILRVERLCVLMSEVDAADEQGGQDGLEEGDDGAAEELPEKHPFAFNLCKDVIRKGSCAYSAECLVCGKKLNTSAHKMMYGHYLGIKNLHMSVHCVSQSKLKADHPDFHASLVDRWATLERKRTIRGAGFTSRQRSGKMPW